MFPKIRHASVHAKIYPICDYVLRFDGCSKGNPGKAGCGAVIYHDNDELWVGSQYLGKKITNNYAEYSGLILGLEKALEMNIYNLSVEGDSQLVINHMNKIYKCKSENLYGLYNKANQLSSQFKLIQFSHIYRSHNKRADELSNIALNSLFDDCLYDHNTGEEFKD